QRLLDRALAKRRDDRYLDAGAFIEAIALVEKEADAEAALVTLAREPTTSAEPTFAEVMRVSSGYLALQLRRFQRDVLPKWLAWTSAQLARASEWLRSKRQPPRA